MDRRSFFKSLWPSIRDLEQQQNYLIRNNTPLNQEGRENLAGLAKLTSKTFRMLAQYDSKDNLVGPLREFWDGFAENGPSDMMDDFAAVALGVPREPRNANTMSSGLLRQIIFNEIMRAYRRRLAPLEVFAHTFNSVPLAGTDIVQVPYYPLDAVGSQEFIAANGYQITPNATTSAIGNIQVGGMGAGVAPGRGRKYKGLQFSAYEILRQPWLNIQMLSRLAGEQLALDIVTDVIGTQVIHANFGDALFSGPPAALNGDWVNLEAQVYCNRADWPEAARSIVLDSSYFAGLMEDEDLKSFIHYGGAEVVRNAEFKGVYSFERIIQNPRLPASPDGNLKGWISWPSAVLVATANCMPGPGEAHRMLMNHLVVDDQSGMAFAYKRWGDPMFSTDYEIIECSYGSSPGDLARLKRIVAFGI